MYLACRNSTLPASSLTIARSELSATIWIAARSRPRLRCECERAPSHSVDDLGRISDVSRVYLVWISGVSRLIPARRQLVDSPPTWDAPSSVIRRRRRRRRRGRTRWGRCSARQSYALYAPRAKPSRRSDRRLGARRRRADRRKNSPKNSPRKSPKKSPRNSANSPRKSPNSPMGRPPERRTRPHTAPRGADKTPTGQTPGRKV